MRVLFVAALPLERSSMVGRTIPLAQEVAAAGHAVEILTLSGRERTPYVEAQKLNGATVRTVGPALRATASARPDPFTTLRRLFAGRSALTRSLTTGTPDVLILTKPQPQNTAPVLTFAARQNIPLVVDLDDLEAHASRMPLPFRAYAAALESRAIHKATALTVASPALVEHVHRIRPDARTELIPTGIQIPATIPSVNLRERLKLPPDAKIILYVGSLSISSGHRVDVLMSACSELITQSLSSPRKRHDVAPANAGAWDQVPDGAREQRASVDSRLRGNDGNEVHLVLAGDGLDTEKLRTMAHGREPLAHRVHFLGRFTPPEDLALAREADLLIDPVDASLTNEAKSSHRVLLALATGTPVVAGNVGIRPFLLPPSLHALCLYNPNSPDALRQALVRGLREETQSAFRQRTTGLIHQWTWPVLGKKFVQVLESVRPRAVGHRS